MNKAARGRAQAEAQGRGDGAGSVTDRQNRNPRVILGGFCLHIRMEEFRSGGLGQVNAMNRRAVFARRSILFFDSAFNWSHWQSEWPSSS